MRAAILAVAAACAALASADIDYLQAGFGNQRVFVNKAESKLKSSKVSGHNFEQVIRYDMDGPSFASPIIVTDVQVGSHRGSTRDIAYVGTLSGTFYAFNANNDDTDDELTGSEALIWKKTVFTGSYPATYPANCYESDGVTVAYAFPTYGVGSTAAASKEWDTVFVVAAGNLYAYDLGTGDARSGFPITGVFTANAEFNYGALNLDEANKIIYIDSAAWCEAVDHHGSVVAVKINLHDGIPNGGSIFKRFQAVTGAGTGAGNKATGGGVWGLAGANIATVTGDSHPSVFVGAAQALKVPSTVEASNVEVYQYGEHLIQLSTADAANGLTPLNAFNPGPGYGFGIAGNVDNAGDISTTPSVFKVKPPSGSPAGYCTNDLVAFIRKSGELFVLNANAGLAKVQSFYVLPGSPDGGIYIGMPVYSADLNLLYVPLPQDLQAGANPFGALHAGVAAFSVNADCTLSLAFNTALNVGGNPVPTPVIANDLLFVTEGGTGNIFVMKAATGQLLKTIAVGSGISSVPTVVNGYVYVTTFSFTAPGSFFAYTLDY